MFYTSSFHKNSFVDIFRSNKSKRIYFELWMWLLISWQMRIKTVEILRALNSLYRRHPKAFFWLFRSSKKIWVISYISIHVISTNGHVTISQWPALQMAWLDRVLCPVISNVRVRFAVKPEIFQVLFQPLRLFIQLWESFPLSYLYPHIKLSLLIFPLVFEFWHILWHKFFNTQKLCFLSRYSNVVLWTEFERNRNFDPDQVADP